MKDDIILLIDLFLSNLSQTKSTEILSPITNTKFSKMWKNILKAVNKQKVLRIIDIWSNAHNKVVCLVNYYLPSGLIVVVSWVKQIWIQLLS